MACKAHLRNQRPLVLAIATNDGLGANAKNIGLLLNARNIYFVPFGQDDAANKPNSLIAKFDMIEETIEAAILGERYQPILV
ncbi:Dipicolinate synthase subunit B [anaerobic digester metagenome]